METGQTFTIPYPFVRDTFQQWDEDGMSDIPTWKPGIRYEQVGPEDAGAMADDVGTATFTLVSVHKPGKYPARAFFTRQFTDPDGKTFGKTKLHICTLEKFRRLTSGFRVQFGIGEPYVENHWRLTLADFQAELSEYAAAKAIEARRAETGTGSVHESAVP